MECAMAASRAGPQLVWRREEGLEYGNRRLHFTNTNQEAWLKPAHPGVDKLNGLTEIIYREIGQKTSIYG